MELLELLALLWLQFGTDLLPDLLHVLAHFGRGLFPERLRALLAFADDLLDAFPLFRGELKLLVDVEDEFHALLFEHGAKLALFALNDFAGGGLPVGLGGGGFGTALESGAVRVVDQQATGDHAGGKNDNGREDDF